jgi:hypothetical protein
MPYKDNGVLILLAIGPLFFLWKDNTIVKWFFKKY